MWPQEEVYVKVAGSKLNVQEPQWRCVVLEALEQLVFYTYAEGTLPRAEVTLEMSEEHKCFIYRKSSISGFL